MSEYKLRPNLFALTDVQGMQTHLEAMARKGWLLVRAGPYMWRYRRSAPQDLRYSVAYFSKDSLYDPEDAPQQRTWREYCEQTGWDYVSGFDCLQIFSTEDPELKRVEASPELQLDAIHSCFKKRERFLWLYLAVMAVLVIGAAVLSYTTDPVEVLADGALQLSCLIMLILALFTGWAAIRYSRWHSKAEKQVAQQGSFTPLKSALATELVVAALVVGLFAWMLVIQSPYERIVSIADVCAYVVIFMVAAITRRIKRKDSTDRKSNLMTTATAVLLAALVLGMVQDLLLNSFKQESSEADMLLPISQLTDRQSTDTYYREEVQISGLLEDITQYQALDQSSDQGLSLQYRITKVKLPALTALCRENCLPAHLQEKLTPADTAAWGAEQGWMNATEGGKYLYYLYYADRTVTLMVNWQLSAQQITLLAQMLQTA